MRTKLVFWEVFFNKMMLSVSSSLLLSMKELSDSTFYFLIHTAAIRALCKCINLWKFTSLQKLKSYYIMS